VTSLRAGAKQSFQRFQGRLILSSSAPRRPGFPGLNQASESGWAGFSSSVLRRFSSQRECRTQRAARSLQRFQQGDGEM